MSKVRGRTGSSPSKEQTLRPDGKFLARRTFDKRTLPEPPRIKRPRVYILGRSPLRAFYYTKTARGRWHTASRVTEGTRWNHYLCSGKAIPKGTRPEIFRAPPAVKGILSSMAAAREKEHVAGRSAFHEQQLPASPIALEVRQHTIHTHRSSGTGWVDVPMPGMQTQYQQRGFVQLCDVPKHHAGTHTTAAPQVPTATISLQAYEAPVHRAVPAESFAVVSPHLPRPMQHADAPVREADMPGPVRLVCARATETRAETPAPIQESGNMPLRLAFTSWHQETRPKGEQLRTSDSKSAHAEPKTTAFRGEPPRSEGIVASSEIRLEAAPTPAEFTAQQIRIEEIRLPKHIGYIPSVRKKERQLKVTQGADGIPPQQ